MINRLFAQLHSATNDGYFVMTYPGRVLKDVNQYLLDFLNVKDSPEHCRGKSADDLLGSLISKEILDSLKHPGDQVCDVEYRVPGTGDSPRWGLINAAITTLPDIPELLIIGSIRDISILKASEERLRRSEEINAIIFSAMPDLLFRFDARGVFLEFRGGQGHLLAMPETFLGQTADAILPPELAEKTMSGIRKVVSTGTPCAYEYEAVVHGEQRYFEARMFPSDDETVLSIIQDITERHRSRQALEETRLRYLTLVENAGDAILVADAESGVILEANTAAEHLFGCPRSDIVGRQQADLYGEEFRDEVNDIFARHSRPDPDGAETLPRRDTVEITRRDNIRVPVEIHANVLTLKGQRLVMGIFRDISERKTAEQELHKSEEKYRFLFSNSPANNILLRRNGAIQDISDTFIRFLGYGRDEVIGGSIFDFVQPDQHPKILEHVERNFNGVPTPGLDVDVKAKDGSIHTILFSPGFLPLREDGMISSILLTGIDITDRKRAEQMIRQSEERYRTIFETSATATVILEDDTTMALANAEFERLSGYSREELEGRLKWDIFVHPADLPRMMEYNRQRMNPDAQLPPNYSFRFIDRQGQERTIFITIAMIPGTDKRVASLLDLSQREKAQKALQESEDRYRRLVELSPDAIAVHADGVLQYHNPAARRIFAAENDAALKGRPILDFVHPEYHTIVGKRVDGTYHRGIPGEPIEEKMFRLNGEVFDAEVSSAPVHFQGKGATLVVVRDITERKRAERTLRESEQRFRALIENSSDIIQTIDNDGTTRYVSPAISRVLGYSREELEGTLSFDFVHPDDVDMAREVLGKLLDRPGGQYNIELRTRHKNGSFRTIQIMATNLLDHPAVKQIVLNYHDITKRKLFEHELEAEKERLGVTLESIGDGVITADTRGTITMLNRVAEELTGWSSQEASGQSLEKVFTVFDSASGDAIRDLMETVLASDKVSRFSRQTVLVDRQGDNNVISMSGAPIRQPGGEAVGVVLVFRDITRQRNMEDELLKRQKLESVGILAGGIAHDFNNILTAIMGNITIAKLYADSPEQVAERITEAEKAVGRAKDLTYQLLTFSRGGMPIKKTKSITQLITDSTDFALRGSNVKCVLDIPEGIWPVDIDEGQISQVLHNLAINADQAMPEGGIINVSVSNHRIHKDDHIPLPSGNYVKIEFTDSGTGILPDHLKKIFDPYFSTKRKGSGLGLTITYSIVKNHDGHIDVHSEIGKGTRFALYLPASVKQPAETTPAPQQVPQGSGRVLVMDDEPSIRDSLTVMLTSLGYQVTTAEDGARTLDIYEREFLAGRKFDVVIMDLTIPGGMGGRETMRQLLQRDPDAIAIVSSGYSNDPVMARYDEYGFKGVIQKPYTVKELADALHSVLQTPAPQQPPPASQT